MNFIDDINTVLKYGVAPSEPLRSGVTAAFHDNPYGPSFQDGKVQDFLQEHDDPREIIVRKHRERYEAGHKYPADEIPVKFGVSSYGLRNGTYAPVYTPDGTVHTYNLHDAKTGSLLGHRLDWAVTSGGSRSYTAVLTPEETADLHSRLLEHFPQEQ